MRSHTAQVRLRNACTCIYMTRYTHVGGLCVSIRVYNILGVTYFFLDYKMILNIENNSEKLHSGLVHQ